MQEYTLNLEKKLQVAMKENSLLKINRRHINQVIYTSVVDKGQNTTKQSFKSRDSQNALLLKLIGHIPKFFDTDVASDFTVSKGTFGKVALLQIDHMKIVMPWEVVPATLKDFKVEIYSIEHKVYSRN